MIQQIQLHNYTSEKGEFFKEIPLTYQVFGEPLGEAEVVLVNHALTGNSQVAGENGWWSGLVGHNKIINLHDYSVIAFDIPNNQFAIHHDFDYDALTVADVARLFVLACKQLQINHLYACVGSSLGGCIAWEIAIQFPDFLKNLIAIGTDWKATDWILAQCEAQKTILENSQHPLADARKMAMLFYRTPESFTEKFNRTQDTEKQESNVVLWLQHHGKKLEKRFSLKAYKTMNYLLSTADITHGADNFREISKNIQCSVYQVGINTDLLFTASENKLTHKILRENKIKSRYFEIKSIHGHDAFLIEYKQLNLFLKHIFLTRFIVRGGLENFL